MNAVGALLGCFFYELLGQFYFFLGLLLLTFKIFLGLCRKGSHGTNDAYL
jgi:hypothetical protein